MFRHGELVQLPRPLFHLLFPRPCFCPLEQDGAWHLLACLVSSWGLSRIWHKCCHSLIARDSWLTCVKAVSRLWIAGWTYFWSVTQVFFSFLLLVLYLDIFFCYLLLQILYILLLYNLDKVVQMTGIFFCAEGPTLCCFMYVVWLYAHRQVPRA